MTNDCAEIKLRAERKAGELLAGMDMHPPGPDRLQPATDLPPTLADIGIRAERAMGELIDEQARKPGQRDEIFHGERFAPPKLSELGVSELHSHRAQLVAAVPEEVFERYIVETKATLTGDVTTAGLIGGGSTLRRVPAIKLANGVGQFMVGRILGGPSFCRR